MTTCEGRREVNKRRTRSELHRAAVQLVARDGLEAVTVAPIADEAGVSARTFFNYYPTKDAAVIGTYPEQVLDITARLRAERNDGDPWRTLESAITEHVVEVMAETELWRVRREVFRRYPHLMGATIGQSREIELALADALDERLPLHCRHLLAALAMEVTRVSVATHIGQCRPGVLNRAGLRSLLVENFRFARPAGLPGSAAPASS